MSLPAEDRSRKLAFTAFLVLAAVVLFTRLLDNFTGLFAMISKILGFISPVLIGIVIAFLLFPLVRLYDEKALPALFRLLKFKKDHPKLRRGLSIALTFLSVLLFFSLLLWAVIPQMIGGMKNIVEQLPAFWQNILSKYNIDLTHIGKGYTDPSLKDITSILWKAVSLFVSSGLETLTSWLTSLSSFLVNLVFGLVRNIIGVFFGASISIYFLYGKEKFIAQMRKTTYAVLPKGAADVAIDLASNACRIFGGYVTGALTDALIVGCLCFIGSTIFGFEYAMVISVLVACTNLIPYLGPYLGGSFGFLLLVMVNPWHAVGFVVMVIVLQQIDGNLIAPRIVGSSTGLPAVWVVLSLLLFGGLWGIPGMLLGTPCFAVIYMVVKKAVNGLLRRKGMSTVTQDYAAPPPNPKATKVSTQTKPKRLPK